MFSAADMARLTGIVAAETDADKALDQLSLAALDVTSSRNAMIALMNEERGTLELAHGHGADWDDEATRERIRVGTQKGEGIVAYVAATASSYLSGDVKSDPRYRDLFGTSVSEIAVPIRDRHGRIAAVLNVESDQRDQYGQEDLVACETIAGLVAIVLDHERLVRREEALVQIGQALGVAITGEELIERVLRVAGEVLRFQSCSIFLLDPEKGLFVLRGSISDLKERVGEVGYAPGEGITGWVCETGQSVRLGRPQSDPRWRGRYLELPNEEIAAFLAVPIDYRGRTIGVIRVLRRVTDNPYVDNTFTEEDERLLASIAKQVATGLENIRSVQKAIRIEQMAAWGELSAKSSHMIGNRVFALKGDVNELGHLLAEADLSREQLAEIQKSLALGLTRVEEILQDFRDFVTATQLALEPADLNAIVRQSVDEVFPRRGPVRLEYELGEGLPPVKVDQRKIRRAISELVENSLGFFETGRLRVATSRASDEQVRRSGLPASKNYLVIEVEDEGPGVDVERKELIFRPFYSSRVKGMGLGLSIVKGIVDAHGGTVYEDGREGQGARFLILLPAAA
ncbi:MAG TPA: GAF domain-containing protein [Fimbriimonadaceae bacterium]|nr:GAF domain-containing protein [Fimbriimonadaceae bacterium]HRJ95466.1 GAF domain-containing protein [Fimbriimonadaceae bacterium]